MSDGVLALLGVLLGGALTGGTNWLTARHAEHVRGRMTAAVLDSVLFEVVAALEAETRIRQRVAFDAGLALQAWRDHRADFALFAARFNEPRTFDFVANAFRLLAQMEANGYFEPDRDDATTAEMRKALEGTLGAMQQGASGLRSVVLRINTPRRRLRRWLLRQRARAARWKSPP